MDSFCRWLCLRNGAAAERVDHPVMATGTVVVPVVALMALMGVVAAVAQRRSCVRRPSYGQALIAFSLGIGLIVYGVAGLAGHTRMMALRAVFALIGGGLFSFIGVSLAFAIRKARARQRM
jgi:hypothetical protein